MLDEFLERFVLPLLEGGMVTVRGPVRPHGWDTMRAEAGALADRRLTLARLRRAQLLVADPELPDVELEELALWVGLHDALVLDHPDRDRVWTRSTTWQAVETVARTRIAASSPDDVREGLARHVAVGAFLDLGREDVVALVGGREHRFLGQDVSPGRLSRSSAGPRPPGRRQRVRWLAQPHRPECDRLVREIMFSSPLTLLLQPRFAPRGWTPLSAPAYLADRRFARTVCHTWAADRAWLETGGAVLSALLSGLEDGAPGADASAREVGDVVAALVHLHFLKVLEFDARLGIALGNQRPGVQSFVALPVLLPVLEPVLGSPLGGLDLGSALGRQVARRFEEYVEHVRELAPADVVENLLFRLVPRVVKTA